MPSKLDPCHDNPVSLGPLWLLGTNCLKTAAAEVIWRLVVPVSFSNSSLQNGRRFHTVGFKFPADSSSPSDAKRIHWLEVTAAMLVKLVLCGTGCFVHFPWKMFSFILLGVASLHDPTVVSSGAVYYVSSVRSLVGRCYFLARTL